LPGSSFFDHEPQINQAKIKYLLNLSIQYIKRLARAIMILQPWPVKVSVVMITFNQERFIGRALESVYSQKTDFPFEVIIGEDCSRDRTQEILKSHKISGNSEQKVFYNQENLGMQRNLQHAYNAAKGEYIAILEGDDYWTSSIKLQTQVNFLDQNPDYSLCFHDVLTVDENGNMIPSIFFKNVEKEDYYLHDILKGNFFQACSVLFRHQILPIYDDWICEAPLGDWPIFTIMALGGRIRRISGQMAAYRVHPGGFWSQQSWVFRVQNTIQTAKIMKKHLGKNVKQELNRTIADLTFELARIAYKKHQISTVVYLLNAFISDNGFTRQTILASLKSKMNQNRKF
jgi:glycosyltransferase involved in cell wall biosynthesis